MGCVPGRIRCNPDRDDKGFEKNKTISQALSDMQKLVIRDMKKVYPEVDYFDDSDLIQTIEDVYSTYDRQLVIVIDEWDAIFRERKEDRDGQKEFLDLLHDLMKDNRHIDLAYMTGILPIKKFGKHLDYKRIIGKPRTSKIRYMFTNKCGICYRMAGQKSRLEKSGTSVILDVIEPDEENTAWKI